MSKSIEQIEKDLDDKIPRSAVSERDGGGGRRLSYLEGHYVIDRLNKVFGPLRWAKEITDVRQITNKTSRGEFPAYLVKVRLTVGFGESGVVVKEAYGYGSDKSSQNAHELAIKEAVTDALKVAAKDLGMSMGLALYDKSQENVSDEEPIKADESPMEKKVVKAPQAQAESNEASLDEAIRTYVRIGSSQKKLTAEEFKQYLIDKFNKQKLAELDEAQKKEALEFLRAKTK